MMRGYGGSEYDVCDPYTDSPALLATLERCLRDAWLQDCLLYYTREYNHQSRIRTGKVLLDESVITYALGSL